MNYLEPIRVPMKIPNRTPVPNKFHYNSYRTLGCLQHPKRLWNYLKFKAAKFSSTINYLPLLCDIEPNQVCNFKCKMCDPAVLFKVKRKQMTFEDFKRFIDEQYGLIEVKIQGVGEPLMNKDFLKMCEYAIGKKLWVRTTLNGSLLHKEDTFKHLIDIGIHDINLSCDGASKKTFETIRQGGIWELFLENAKLLNDYNSQFGNGTKTRAWVVIQDGNKHEFFEFPKVFADLGFKEMCYSFAMHNYGRDEENAEDTPFDFTNEDLVQVMEIGEKLGIEVFWWQHPSFTKKQFCHIPFQRVYLTTDMHIVPCCYIANQEVVDFGHYDDFKNIWFTKYNSFRDAMKDPDVEIRDYCKNCYGGKP